VTEWYRVAFGELYPLVYPHRDIAEAARVAAKLAPMLKAARPTLDVACGNGRYMCALRSTGLDMYGVDLSEYLLGEAAGRGIGDRVVCGDMRALPFGDGVFGSAINMFTSFGYFDDDADNAGALGEIARVIAPGGTFVLDFINAGRVRDRVEPRSRRSVGDASVEEWRELAHGGRVLSKRVEVTAAGREPVVYSERLRLYDRRELTAMLAGAGFEVRGSHGDYELGAFHERDSDRLIMVSEKRMVAE
jgi:SAM-dependent methyltransferase